MNYGICRNKECNCIWEIELLEKDTFRIISTNKELDTLPVTDFQSVVDYLLTGEFKQVNNYAEFYPSWIVVSDIPICPKCGTELDETFSLFE